MRKAIRDKVQSEFSGRLFATDFWHKVQTAYLQLLSTGWQPLRQDLENPATRQCMIEAKDWPRIFTSVPQPVSRLQTGSARVMELGGAFVCIPDGRRMELHDWSVVAEYIDPHAPSLILAQSIKQLDGCFLPQPGDDYHVSVAHRVVKDVASRLMPYPGLYAAASKIYRWMRQIRRTLMRHRNDAVDGNGPSGRCQLVRHNVQGMNILCNERNTFYAIPMCEGEFSQKRVDNNEFTLCIKGRSLADVLHKLERLPIRLEAIQDIELIEENFLGFNLIRCSNRFFAIRPQDGAFHLQKALNNGYPKMISGHAVAEVKTILEKRK